MATNVRHLTVSNEIELARSISDFAVQGFIVVSREPGQATLRKNREFSTLWAVIGFVVCLLPLLIYLIVYATQKDEVVIIEVSQQWGFVAQGAVPPYQPSGTTYSPDGNYWWDGTTWQPVGTAPAAPFAAPAAMPPQPYVQAPPATPRALPSPGTLPPRPRLSANPNNEERF